MPSNTKISRRVAIGAIATMAATPVVDATASDAELIALCQELEKSPAMLERSSSHDEVIVLFARMEKISTAIATARATSLDGLIAKAGATGWAFDPDFDPLKESSEHMRIAASITRDLLQLRATCTPDSQIYTGGWMSAEKYIGTVLWINPTDDTRGSADISRCVIQPSEKKVIFDTVYDRRRYDVKLYQHGDVFRGSWESRVPTPDSGPLTCVMIRNGDDVCLSGTWHEEGTDFKLLVNLQRVESFDEDT